MIVNVIERKGEDNNNYLVIYIELFTKYLIILNYYILPVI